MKAAERDLLFAILVETLVLNIGHTPEFWWDSYPPMGAWVVEQTHIMGGGCIAAIGKVVGRGDGITLELLDGSTQRWANSAFAQIKPIDTRTFAKYQAHLAAKDAS